MSETPDVPIALRPASLGDVDAIVAIERQAFSDPWTARSFRELVGQPNILFEVAVRLADAPQAREAASAAARESAGAVGEVTDTIVGFSVVYLAGDEGDLANLATAESSRRGGVGRRLLQHVLAVARARGAHVIFLEVRESNAAARALYHSAGFVDVGRRAKYYARPVEDALVLRVELS